MSGTENDIDIDAALAAAYADKEVAEMGDPRVRKKRERRNAAHARSDLRTLRKTDRTFQLNIRITADLKERLHRAVKMTGRPMAAVAEELFEAFVAQTLKEARRS